MRNVFWTMMAVLLLSALPARPAEPAPRDDAHKTAADLAREKMEKLREKRRSAATPPTPRQKQADADRIAAVRAKSTFMYAVEACDEPVRCDAALRDDAERAFMEACNVCAPADRCEAERAAIKAGTTKRTDDPCARK